MYNRCFMWSCALLWTLVWVGSILLIQCVLRIHRNDLILDKINLIANIFLWSSYRKPFTWWKVISCNVKIIFLTYIIIYHTFMSVYASILISGHLLRSYTEMLRCLVMTFRFYSHQLDTDCYLLINVFI